MLQKIIAIALGAACSLACLIALFACSSEVQTQATPVIEDTGFAMGTVVTQSIYSEDSTIPAKILSILEKVENNFVSWRKDDSDVARINKNVKADKKAGKKADKSTKISYETRNILDIALAISKDSGGAFDPTIGRLTRLWDFESNKNVIPSKSEISKAIKGFGYKNLSLRGDEAKLAKTASLDLGGIGKGAACDQVELYLEGKSNIDGALLNFGGSSILTYGNKPDGKLWNVAITNPSEPGDFLATLKLEGTNNVTTSGDYEKYFEKDGVRYHHILDPKTGFPAHSGLRQATILSESGAVGEGLSTACFVLGKDASRDLIKKYGVEAMFVDENKKIYVTEGIKNKLQLLDESYEVIEEW